MGVNDVQSIRLGIIFEEIWHNVVGDTVTPMSKDVYMRMFLHQQGLPENFFEEFKPLELKELRELWK